jgi:DNA-binding NarL/FixJ family response regulator
VLASEVVEMETELTTSRSGQKDRIRLLIADDHPLFRAGVRERLAGFTDSIEVIGEACDGEEAYALAGRLHPDVVLMDIAMPGVNGIEATRRIKASWADIGILILTVYDDEQYIHALVEAGAAGYLLKTVEAVDLVDAIRRVGQGESVLSPAIARKVLARFAGKTSGQEVGSWESLSERERQVLRLAAKGESNKLIASHLNLSIRTVHAHMGHIFDKLSVASRTEAVVSAIRHGWLTEEDLP